MIIEFTGPSVPSEDGGISFRADVDGQTVACKFSTEALQDIDSSLTMSSSEDQFEASKSKLLLVAENKIRNGAVVNGVVHIFTSDI